jgi:hypothetical protein
MQIVRQSLLIWVALLALASILKPLPTSRAQTPANYAIAYINDAGELVAFNPADLSQRVLLGLPEPLSHSYGLYPSPDGAYLGVFIRSNDLVTRPLLSLVILDTVTGQSLWDENLLPDGYQYPLEAPLGQPDYEMSRALGEVVWSPDSRYAAFINGQTGQAEITLWDSQTQLASTLTTPAVPAFLVWNPSSSTLVFADLTSFGDGSGLQVAGYYSANIAAQSVTALTLPDPAPQSGLALIGWIDDSQFLYSSLSFIFGGAGIGRYDLTANLASEVLPSRLAIGLPIFDSAQQTLAFVVPDISDAGLVPGAYLWPLEQPQPTLLQSGPFYSVHSPRPGLFQYESAQGSYLLDLSQADSALQALPIHQFGAYLSPQADALVLARQDGVYVSSLGQDDASLVWNDQAQVPIWSPDGSVFYSYGFLNDQAGLVEVNVTTRQARLLDSRMAVTSPRAVIQAGN